MPGLVIRSSSAVRETWRAEQPRERSINPTTIAEVTMFDGFWSGIFGGLFGPPLAKWLSKFRYWMIFFTTTISVHGIAFIQDWMTTDFKSAWHRSAEMAFTIPGFMAPIGIGLLAVLGVFIGSLGSAKSKLPPTNKD